MATTWRIERIYSPAAEGDGYRVLVDRLWPRGVSKERAALDRWDKDVAPSPELRTWWDHDPARMDEFAARYRAELDSSEGRAALDALREAASGHETVTLLYAAKDPQINHARILRDVLAGTPDD